MNIKRLFYIALFALLGVILQFLAHALIEMWYIELLLVDFPRYGFGLTWDTWVLIHNILTVLFFVAGAWIGYKEGVYWWRKIYEENAIALWKEKWKDKKIPTIWLIVLFLILLAGSACWYYVDDVRPYLNKESDLEWFVGDENRLNNEIKKNSAETAGWQTYRNEECGFEIKYPKDFIKVPSLPSEIEFATNDAVEGRSGPSQIVRVSCVNTNVPLSIYVHNLDIERHSGEEGGFTPYSQKEVIISGKNAIKRGISAMSTYAIYETIIQISNDMIVKFEILSSVPNPTAQILTDQILSTFKFIK